MIFGLLGLACAINIENTIPNYVLTEGETFYLPLNNYFSGDFLEFQSSNTSLQITNNNCTINQIPLET